MEDKTSKSREEWLWEQWGGLLWNVRRSIRYHSRRRRFFDNWHTISSAVSVLFGSATFFVLLAKANPLIAEISAAIVTLFATLDLVVGTAASARLHDDLARRFIALEQELTQAGEPTEENLPVLLNKRLAIEADEPPVLSVLNSMCHNELVRAEGRPESERIPIGFFQRHLAHRFDLNEQALHKIGEHANA